MNKLFPAFTPQQQNLLLAICVITLISLVFHFRKKDNWAILFLFIAAFTIRCCMALLDPFINLWDEQFHALVARNLMDHPLTPTIYARPILGYDIANWTGNHIWLHKQPLFMWQMAASLKLFGLNEFALRLPSALMGAAMVFLLFRMGKLIVNSTVGYYAALLYAFANYQLEFVAGFTQLDHNDAAFIFYITASIWAWVEYYYSSNKKWVYVIGILAGCAILTKWLVGMLVFSGWGVTIISNPESRTKLSSYIPIIKSFLTACLVFLPWQIYTRITFPAESKLESDYNVQHIFKVIEGHTGGNWYHFDMITNQYGKLVPYLLLLAIFIFIKQVKNRAITLGFMTFIIAPYLFFLIVKTKMPSFCIVAAPVIYLLLGNLLYEGLSLFSNFPKKILIPLSAICLLFIVSWSLNLQKIITNHELPFPHYPFRVARIVNTPIDKQVVNLLPSKDYVIFNCGGYNTTLVMFFSGMPAYGFQPEWADYEKMKKDGVKMAIFDDGKLRDYLKNDPEVFKIKRHLILETY